MKNNTNDTERWAIKAKEKPSNLGDAKESSFDQQFTILARPFQYLLKTDKNIINAVWANGLAEEIQYIIICEIKREKPAARIRDNILVSSTRYMAQIFEQILNLFTCDYYNTKHDIKGLFYLLIENTYRLESTITPTFHETISLNSVRAILGKYEEWVIELRSKFFDIA